MSEQTMIERVARAIGQVQTGADNMDDLIHHPAQNSWEAPSMPRWKQWEDDGRAAIEAMREPTDMMGCGLNGDYKAGWWSATRIWKAMIDAALSDHATTDMEARK